MGINFNDDLLAKTLIEVIEWRRHLHRHPELSFEEYNTAEFIYNELNKLGELQVSRPTNSSVLARLITLNPGPVLALRADIDALPIVEETDLPFKSENQGVMHACGHDGHTAVLLGVAKILCSVKEQLCGELRFIFQHAEESPPGGAIELVNAGVLDGVDLVIGQHLMAHIPTGKVVVRKNELFAGGDIFKIKVIGKGGHGGIPHETIDSVTIAAQVVTNLQQIVARNVDPLDSLVISTTTIMGGTTSNVIPDSVEMSGTTRYFNKVYKEKLPNQIERIIKGITEAHGASYEFNYLNGYLPLINDAQVCDLVIEAGLDDLGIEVLQNFRPTTGAEDFSAYLEKVPGCFILIGAGNESKGITYPHHHPKFTVDEDALSIAVNVFLKIVGKINSQQSPEVKIPLKVSTI